MKTERSSPRPPAAGTTSTPGRKRVTLSSEELKRERWTAETTYLLTSEAMKRRLLEARQRRKDIPLDEVRKKLGLE